MIKREYSVQELADILGCSRPAIAKKIKVVDSVTGTKRYKNRFEVVTNEGKMFILLDDNELEEEKRLSKGFSNVSNNGYETPKNDDIIDVEVEKIQSQQNQVFEFTERYIERFATLQKDFYNELQQRDKQILLLTTSENSSKNEIYQVKAENTTLKKRNFIITLLLTVVTTLLLVTIIGFVTYLTLHNNISKPSDNVVETQKETVEAPAPIANSLQKRNLNKKLN